MLVVLYGDSLHIYVTALSLVEFYGPTAIQILVLEDKLGDVSQQLSYGPLPWCVTSLSGLPNKRFLNSSTYQRTESSTMFLESVTRFSAFKSQTNTLLDQPTIQSLSIKPSPKSTDLFLYHPSIFKIYLRNVLSVQRNVSFAAIRTSNQNINESIRHSLAHSHFLNQKSLLIKVTSLIQPSLQKFELAHVNWVGMLDARLPNSVMVMKKYQSIVDVRMSQHNTRDNSFEIQTSATTYDLTSSLRISQYVEKMVENMMVKSGELKWSRL